MKPSPRLVALQKAAERKLDKPLPPDQLAALKSAMNWGLLLRAAFQRREPELEVYMLQFISALNRLEEYDFFS